MVNHTQLTAGLVYSFRPENSCTKTYGTDSYLGDASSLIGISLFKI